jgi:hypothetical protein
MCFTWVNSSLTHKYLTRLKRSARDKHSSFSQTFIDCECKSFIILGPGHQTSLMFVGKARSLPLSGAPERYFILLESNLSHKHWTRLGKLKVTSKHSSLSQIFINYGCKKFITLSPEPHIIKLLMPIIYKCCS